MIKKSIYIVLLTLVILSCKKDPKQVAEEISDIEEQNVIVSNIGVQLNSTVKESISSWSQFTMLTEIIEDYTSITKNQALDRAKDVSNMTKDVIDRIGPELLDKPYMKIRFNVVYNQALRLDDMSTIPNISDEEVEIEVAKLLAAFSSVNDKINSIYMIDEFDKKFIIELQEAIDTVNFAPQVYKKGIRKLGKPLKRRRE